MTKTDKIERRGRGTDKSFFRNLPSNRLRGWTLLILKSIYKFGLPVCLFVCLYPINVKTAEPIGPKFVVGHHVTTGKVYE